MSKLYVVGTPIGNLGDMSPRGIQTLRDVDFIAAEDTRVSLKLLNRFEIKKPMISYHDHNIREKGELIINRIISGESCAIITDAGMPCISDPGEDLVKLCAANNIEVVAVPGPSAVVTALALSGLATSRFSFEGFLSVKKSSRFEHLNSVKDDERTMIFYEAPHKLLATLQDMLTVFGDRKISLVREATKMHEQVLRTTIAEAAKHYEQNTPKGEFVLVIEGTDKPIITDEITFEDAVEMVKKQQAEGVSASVAAKSISSQTGYKKGDLYKAALEN